MFRLRFGNIRVILYICGITNNNTVMNVYVYVDYRQDKETGEEQFETPEVYATKEAAVIKEVKQAFI